MEITKSSSIAGDRIAIISKGSLLCCGSFEYLKHHFGSGHRLILVQNDRRPSAASRTLTVTADIEETDNYETSPCIVDASQPNSDPGDDTDLTNFVQSIVTGASVIERRGRELHYHLPLLQARPRTLARLFSEMEEHKQRLGVVSYGMSSCTMEEVQCCYYSGSCSR